MNAARSVTISFAIAVADKDGDGDVDGQDLAGYSADLADGIDVLQVEAFAAIFGEEVLIYAPWPLTISDRRDVDICNRG